MNNSFFIKSLNLLKKFILPKSIKDDLLRQEFILNILIVSAGFTISSSIIVYIFILFSRPQDLRLEDALPLSLIVALFIFFGFLYFLSRKGFFRLASYIFLGIFFLFASYMSYLWGVDVSVGLLFYTLTIVMSGILISTRFAFLTTLATGLTIGLIVYLHTIHFVEPNRYWTTEIWRLTDVIVVSILFLVIATVSWLSNREIEKSLVRARKSEADLREERDSLEVKVEERTKELKEVQAEKMTQLYRFAEFGRISSGLFHDLINPLNAVSLNMEKLKSQHVWLVRDSGKPNISLDETSDYLERAVSAARRLENMVAAVRKQLARKETRVLFSIDEEIRHVIDVLSHKAQKANVELRFMPGDAIKTLKIFGDAVKFNQVMLNLIANGIDACMSVKNIATARWVQVSLVEESEVIIIGVEDNGVGISERQMDKIFEPFFTTKTTGQGIGIGLLITKRIVEKDFGGLLVAKSKVGKGSSFKVSLPIRKQVIEYA